MDDQKDRGGIVDKANSAIKTAKNLRNAVRLARTAATVGRTAATAAATSEVWIPAVIIGVIVLIIIFTVIILMGSGGSSGNLGGGNNPTPPPPGSTISIVSCPVPGGTIFTPSFQADPVKGHCGKNYVNAGFSCDPGGQDSRRAKSIDVPTGSNNVVLPLIEGKSVKWAYVNHYPIDPGDCESPVNGRCGSGMVFVSHLDNGDVWTLFLVHVGFTGLVPAQSYDSGTIVGSGAIDHVHISVGKNLFDPASAPPGSSDTRLGLLAPDKDLGMCVTTNNTASNTCTRQYEGTGPCTPSNLMPYFGNDSTKALIASLICQAESCSNQFSFNNACTTGASLDYSIGFFQINALVHCNPQAFSYSSNPISCTVIDEAARQACETRLFSAEGNIQAAVGVSDNGTNWTPWSTWTTPNSCGIGVVNVLTKCGIKY